MRALGYCAALASDATTKFIQEVKKEDDAFYIDLTEDEIAALRASMGAASSEEIERLKAKHAEEKKELGR